MREIPIYIEDDGKLIETTKTFKIVSVQDNFCTVVWPNGVVDEQVPIEMMDGQFAKIAETDIDKYFSVHSSTQAVEKLHKLVNALSDRDAPKITTSQIEEWCKPPVKGGLKIGQLRKKATDLGITSATSMKKAEIKAELLKLVNHD